jgi:hypothetical protein
MSPTTSVEEVLTRTLRQAGELAVPDGVLAPFQIVDEVGLAESEPPYESKSASPGWTRLSPRVMIASFAAVVLVVVGLVALLVPSSSTTVERTQLSTARGEQLFCGIPGCSPFNQGPAFNAPRATAAKPPVGANQDVRPSTQQGTWIVADGGHFVRAANGVTGTLYLSAGGGRYYRFVLSPGSAPLTVVNHDDHTVTLKGHDGTNYVLNLRTSELFPR